MGGRFFVYVVVTGGDANVGRSADAGEEEEELPRYSTAAEQGAPPKYLDEPPPGYGDDVVIVMVRG